MKVIINSLPKAGNNLLASYIEKTENLKRSDVWGISSMSVLQPTRAAARNRNDSQTSRQGMIAGLFMPVEIDTRMIVNQLNRVQDNEYIICHMPNQFLRFVKDHGFEVYHIQRDLMHVVESNYHYIHREKYHPLNEIFNRTKDRATKYRWLLEGKVWADHSLVGVFDAQYNVHEYAMYADKVFDYDDLYAASEKMDLEKKKHVFRQGSGKVDPLLMEIWEEYTSKRVFRYNTEEVIQQ